MYLISLNRLHETYSSIDWRDDARHWNPSADPVMDVKYYNHFLVISIPSPAHQIHENSWLHFISSNTTQQNMHAHHGKTWIFPLTIFSVAYHETFIFHLRMIPMESFIEFFLLFEFSFLSRFSRADGMAFLVIESIFYASSNLNFFFNIAE